MSARTLIAAAIQLDAHERSSFEQVWPQILDRVREALDTGARLLVLPEGTAPGYVLGYGAYDGAATQRVLADCRSLAAQAGAVLIIGAARQDNSRLLNSALVIDTDGSLAGHADKHFLWHFDRQWFAPGESIEPVRTNLGSIGVLVCADGRIPTIARRLVDRGAEVLAMPTAWVTSGRDPELLENVQADLLARVRARENGVPFIAANKCGVEGGNVLYCGKSQIVGHDGTQLALASQDRSEIIYGEVHLDAPRRQRLAPKIYAPAETFAARRIAISPHTDLERREERLRILEADTFVGPGISQLDGKRWNVLRVDDEAVTDPGGLPPARAAGHTLAVWETSLEYGWQVTIARARALELRMYLVVIDAALPRAYAVDPDGALLCGTFGTYELASFAYDPQRAAATKVAPGTDVLEGLDRVAALDRVAT
ncbi:MAG: carbon-nitrogen hydrolase family protein [Candidatus Eremiobacteraeota bacterium]|nr:carbon-nitrogen hydrolase family protein [Candidatus Eremiobacteraeota bacterium]